MKLFLALLALTFATCISLNAQEYSISSPNGEIVITFDLQESVPTYSVIVGNQPAIVSSRLGLQIEPVFSGKYEVLDHSSTEIDESYETVWWKNRSVVNRANEMTVSLQETASEKKRMNIIFRAFDDGIAFRYELPKQANLEEYTILSDLTEFVFDDDYLWWSANGERDNLGPMSLNILRESVFAPMVLQISDQLYVAIHEAAIYDFANYKIKKGVRSNSVQCDLQGLSKGKTGMQTSWRAVIVGNTPGDLMESNMLVNLNPPCKIEDTSWIKPGLSMWDWRAWGYEAPDGFVYGLNTPSHKRFIDFAAENNIQYLLMDADWYGPEFSETSDPTKSNKEIDIEENMRYAKANGVGIILYLNDVGARKFGLERVLKQFHEWGASGVKYGFMRASGQEKVLYTRKVIELCAKYQLTVNFHDNPIPPSGDERTWPNVMTREYCHSQADAKYSYYPETAVSSAFINQLAGPVDMCNGWYAFEGAESRPKVFKFLPGTVAAENAKLLVVFSGVSVLPDAPEAYNAKSDLFEFVKMLPQGFDEYRVLGGHIEQYISVARRSGERWYIGSLTTRESRNLELSLEFLKPNKRYLAYLYEDAPKAHFINNREAYKLRNVEVTSSSKLRIFLAPGGGNAIRIEPLN